MNKNVFDDEAARDWLVGVLKDLPVTISFTKKDGTKRDMKCTLNGDLIGSENAPKGVERSKPTESLAVFDLEKNAWRSFRWDSITEIRFTLGEDE